jgi:SAM-dependent methyltransferase
LKHNLQFPGSLWIKRYIYLPLWQVRKQVLHCADQMFDLRYGTQTSGRVETENIAAISPNRQFGLDYYPTDGATFPRMVRCIPEPHAALTFVDFGCGKGRVLLMAAQQGFRSIIGVEYSAALAQIARHNIDIFRPRAPAAELRVVCADATDFTLPDGDCVLYFFNPFEKAVITRVLENLRAAYIARPRRFYVILWNCENHYALFDSLPFLQRLAEAKARRNWLTRPIFAWLIYGPKSA